MLMFDSLISVIFVFLSAVFIALYFYFNRNFKFWHKLGVPYVKPTPFFGNLKDCVLQKVNIGKLLQQIYEEHNDKPYVGIFTFDKPSLLIRDCELVKNILVKDSHNFIDRVITLNERLDPLFGKSLFVVKGQRWRILRSNLSPVFTSGKMKMMFYLVDTCGKELVDCLHRATADGPAVDALETMYRYTTDVIASCGFGINGNSLQEPHAEFRRILRKIYDFSVTKGFAALTAFCAPTLTSILQLKFIDDKTTNYLREAVWSTVEYRQKNGIVRHDILDCLMEMRNKGRGGGGGASQQKVLSEKNPELDSIFEIDGDDFVAQAFVFLAGGFETSGSTLCFTLYEIAMHPEIQHKLRVEILQVLNRHNGQLTYDGIQEMSYMDIVLSETLRKYPILPFLDRMTCSDYELPSPTGNGTVTLPAGTGVYIPVLALHHDPAYFPEPEKFDPDRFTEENKRSRPKYTYIPFGEGPRMCLGMRFAMMQMKTGMCHILSCFEVTPCEDTPRRIVFDTKSFEIKTTREIKLSFKRTNFLKITQPHNKHTLQDQSI